MLRSVICIVIILQYRVAVESAKSRFNIDIQNISCRSFTPHLIRYKCAYEKVATSYFTFSQLFMSDKVLNSDIDVRLRLQIQMPHVEKSINFFDIKINMCRAFTYKFGNLGLKIIIEEIRKRSNFPYNCPLKKNFLYKVENYTLTDKSFPLFTPNINGVFTLELYENNTLFSNYIAHGSVMPKK